MRTLAGRGRRSVGCALLMLCAVTTPATAADSVPVVIGQPISAVIDAWRQRGVPFAYSTELIDDDMVVQETPEATDAEGMVSAILAPYGLMLYRVEGLLIVGLRKNPAPTAPPAEAASAMSRGDEPSPLPEVTVSASRYEILRDMLEAPSFISQRTIQQLPLLGEDPLRAVQRLPGNASGGASAKSHLRGSTEQDTGLVLNGQRLLDPFHVRDFHNLFSAIDSRAISGIEVYTGGFPAKYGNGIGGLLLIDTVTPDSDRHTEIGLSVYNTSLLSAGRAAGGEIEWLVSARRGNLDLLLNPELGEPSYNDVFAEIAFHSSGTSRLSVNALVANDNVLAVTESDPEEREASENDTRNAQFWLNWRMHWTDELTSVTSLSVASLNVLRSGRADDAEEIIARVDDRRDIDMIGWLQDWTITWGEDHLLSFGASAQHVEGKFHYRGDADFFGNFALIDGAPAAIRRELNRRVDGDLLGAYLSDRWQLRESTAIELGFRWDKQTYTDTANETQFSPRFSLLQRVSDRSELRLNAGRYFQPQGINELQLADGVNRYFPAERADQVVIGVQTALRRGLSLRVEGYWKAMHGLRPYFENLLDPLAVMPELKPDRVRVDASRARARGIEVSLAQERAKHWNWWLSYTLARVEDRVNGDFVPRSWDQRHAGQFGLLWSGGRWDFSMVASGHSGWPRTGLQVASGSDPDEPTLEFLERNSGNHASYMSIDLRVAYRAPMRRGELSLFFELSNALDRNNACCIDFEVDDESGSPLLMQNDEYWFPMLPAVGILWEF